MMPAKERKSKPIRRTVPKTEPVVGDPYERVQITLQDLAHRIERIRYSYEQYRRKVATGTMSPRERKRDKEGMRAGIDILVEQSKGFARDRGVEGDFIDGLRNARRQYHNKAKRKRFGYYLTRTVSEVERFLEEHRLLLNVDPPPYSFVDDTWRQIVDDGKLELEAQKHAKTRTRRPELPPSLAEPKPVTTRDAAKIDSREVKDADDTEQ